jgi:phosphatidylserine/phosphatidylglycerophosphate/cardiolipin synthase-like enzyme
MHRAIVILVVVAAVTARATPSIDVCFSPGGDCEQRVVHEIQAAKEAVLVQAHVFTSRPIADALVAAQRRGAKVRTILDKSNQNDRYSAAGVLKKGGVEVLIDGHHPVANSKVIIIDEQVVLTGSMNFTKAADDSNVENLMIIRDPAVAERFVENWNAHLKHAQPFKGGGAAADSGGKSAAPAGSAKPPAGEQFVVITENGKRYHREDCETLKGGGVRVTIEEARKKGRTPCLRCKPPE